MRHARPGGIAPAPAPSSFLVAGGTSLASRGHRPTWQRRGVKTTPIAVPNATSKSRWGLPRVILGVALRLALKSRLKFLSPCCLPDRRLVCGHLLWVTGMRLPSGDYLIIVSHDESDQVMADYAKRLKKKHQRPAKSVFRYGFDSIRNVLFNPQDKQAELRKVLLLL
jgi:hypothetical protein